MVKTFLCSFFVSSFISSFASDMMPGIISTHLQAATTVFSPKTQAPVSPAALIERLHRADIVILGETHDSAAHHTSQAEIMQTLGQDRPLFFGMEFFAWTQQDAIDDYQQGTVDEANFLKTISWKDSNSFAFYRPLIEIATRSGGKTYGINAPRTLTKKIGKYGLDALDANDKALLPEDFKLGSEAYWNYFKQVVTAFHPAPEDALRRYFAAQSTWDDTMAYHVLQNRPGLYVIVVGNFHAEYELGLAARLRARATSKIDIVTLVHADSKTNFEALKENDNQYGAVADYIVLSEPQ